jgi:hypothetical protein
MQYNKIFKPKKFDRFTVVPNAIFRHKGISATATGLYCWLFSHDSNTEMTVQFICGHFKEGKDAINKKIKELIETGFLVRVEVRKGGKFAGYNYHLNDTATGKTGAGKTAAVFTAAVNPQQSNTNINYTNKEILKKEIPTKSEKRQFDDKTKTAFPHFAALFDLKYRPKTETQKIKWLDCLDKLQRLDGYDLREVYNVSKNLRNDEFWQNNFLSILKLRNTDKNGIKYIDRFMVQHKAKQKPVGFTKIKNLKEFFIYKNPSNGKKEIGAKTKNGDIHEFQIRGLMMTNEFQELKKYVLNEL